MNKQKRDEKDFLNSKACISMTLTHFIIILFKVITQFFFHKEHERIDISKQFFSEFHKSNKFSIKHNYAIQSIAKNIDLKSIICKIFLGKLGNISSKKI